MAALGTSFHKLASLRVESIRVPLLGLHTRKHNDTLHFLSLLAILPYHDVAILPSHDVATTRDQSLVVRHALMISVPKVTHIIHLIVLQFFLIVSRTIYSLPDQVNVHAGLSPAWFIDAIYTHCSAHDLYHFPMRSGTVPLWAVM